MLRRVSVLIACLCFGVVVNVAVAWSCVLWTTPGAREFRKPEASDFTWWARHAPEGYAAGPATSFSQDRTAFGVCNRRLWGGFPRPGGATSNVPQDRRRAGWPCLSMEGVVWKRPGGGPAWTEALLDVPSRDVRLPLRPIPGGFIANTLLGAALPLTLLVAFATARHLVRGWRGRCRRCGYPIGASPACTECGAPVRRG